MELLSKHPLSSVVGSYIQIKPGCRHDFKRGGRYYVASAYFANPDDCYIDDRDTPEPMFDLRGRLKHFRCKLDFIADPKFQTDWQEKKPEVMREIL